MRKNIGVSLAFLFILVSQQSFAQKLQLNELGYFEKQGLNILVFTNEYNGMFFDEKTAGVEIIQHGVRISTGGAVRLQNTPEQWDQIPKVTDRKVNRTNNAIEVSLIYESLGFKSKLKVTPKGDGIEIAVYLDEALPEELEGRAGFNLEFLPSAFFEKTFLMDGKPGLFPRYPASNTRIEDKIKKITQYEGHTTFDDRGKEEFIIPYPIATGRKLTLAPEDPERLIKIEATETDLMLFDGRNLAQNGWFIVESKLPANKTGKVLTWYLEPYTKPAWIRDPVLGYSQVGYIPDQQKVAVVELDKNDTPLKTAAVFQVSADGETIKKYEGDVKVWGDYMRYCYAKFDFTPVREPGVYFIQYGNTRTGSFLVDKDVYADTWQATLDVWFPVQMDHMTVNEAYRTWHGEPYKDDCLQAPLNHQHFDGYSQGPTTDTKFKPLERIPGMAVGGWFDAGDFDIQTGSHNNVITNFVDTWEYLKVDRDQTYIDQKTRYVDIHRPDGQPDLLQQIEHGTLNLVAQVENIGHPIRGIIVPHLHQYHHLGDAMTETDNLPYNPKLKPYESDGKSSGTFDDRWAFTNRSAFLDYQTTGSLAAASRVLKGYNDELALRALAAARKLLPEADEAMKNNEDNPMMRRFGRGSDLNAVLQMYITTKEKPYVERFLQTLWTALDELSTNGGANAGFFIGRYINTALIALPYMDAGYKSKLEPYIVRYKETLDKLETDNPYGVPIRLGGWGGTSTVTNWVKTNYFAHLAYPEIIGDEYIFKGMNYIFGCHPYSNLSFVNAIGTHSKNIAYGSNRADFTTIAGGIVPGLILLKPDFLENKDDWPFLWGENEVTIGGSAEYIFVSCAVNEMLTR